MHAACVYYENDHAYIVQRADVVRCTRCLFVSDRCLNVPFVFSAGVNNMSWARAVWIEDDVEEGVVPRVWIENKIVRWPKGINITRAFSEQKSPLDNWLSFPLLKIKVTSGLCILRLFSKRPVHCSICIF